MARRIGIWALSGAAVALFWFFYFTWLTWGAYHGGPAFEFSTFTQKLVDITASHPAAFRRHHAMTWYWSLISTPGFTRALASAWRHSPWEFRSRLAHARH